jgi:hypothetical protein
MAGGVADMVPSEEQAAPSRRALRGRSWAIGVTSFFFLLLQSACSAFVALSGARLLIGVGALAAAGTGLKFMASLHGSAIRIPMEIVAIAGSAINLIAIARVRSLRARPSSQWRMTQPSKRQRRSEFVQVLLAVLTLLLVAVEWIFHIHFHGTI